jgi:hypothetical protein
MHIPPSECGVHIHSGTSCASADLQGGHYSELSEDPWTDERYAVTGGNPGGFNAAFKGLLEIGTTDVEGRAFVGK